MNILRSYIKTLIGERARDIQYFSLSQNIFKKIITNVYKRNLTSENFHIDNYEGTLLHWLPLKSLITHVPEDINNEIVFGIIRLPDKNTYLGHGFTIQPGENETYPYGGVIVCEYDTKSQSFSTDELLMLLNRYKSLIIHELVHLFDFNIRDDANKLNAFVRNKNVDTKQQYYTADHELNAYFFQAFNDMLTKLKRQYPHLTRTQATTLNNDIWNYFFNSLNQQIKQYNDENMLMRRYLPRLIDMWNEFLTTLPDGFVEEVERFVQSSAGFIGGANVGSGRYNDRGYLGDNATEEEQEKTTIGKDEEQIVTNRYVR